ncbi:MAG: DUF262 domain-containing HNH endonuclease family protein [bacterium]
MATKNLSELFANQVFRIPDYQRGYAWGERQWNELWDDLKDISSVKGDFAKHYTGTIFIEPMDNSKIKEDEKWAAQKHKFYNVVDGQQRLTTIVILLNELLQKEEEGYGEESVEDLKSEFIFKSNMNKTAKLYKFGYIDDFYNNYIQNIIFGEERGAYNKTAYTENLSKAKEFFKGKIEKLSKKERDEIYYKVSSSLIFDERIIEDDLDVQAVFETMNNRGKPLSTLEKLKNRLIYLTEKLNDPLEGKIALRKEINSAWAIIFAWLGKNPGHILNEDEFLSVHLSLYRVPKDSIFSELAADKKIFEMFCNRASDYFLREGGQEKEPLVTYEKIYDYIKSLSSIANIWYLIHNTKSIIIKKILILNSKKDVKLLLITLLRYFGIDNEEKLCNHKELNTILNDIELVLFRNSVPGLWVADYRVMATWARDLFNGGEVEYNEITEKLQTLKKTDFDINRMITDFSSLFVYVKGAKGFHRWGGLKYFLFEFEEYLKDSYKESADKVDLNDFESTSIEHIMPQDSSNWGFVVNGYLGEMNNDEEKDQAKKIIINTLGNLTILIDSKNSSLGNDSWSDKKNRYRTGSYNEINISQYEYWDGDSIDKRGRIMLDFLFSKIKMSKPVEGDITKILYTDIKYQP